MPMVLSKVAGNQCDGTQGTATVLFRNNGIVVATLPACAIYFPKEHESVIKHELNLQNVESSRYYVMGSWFKEERPKETFNNIKVVFHRFRDPSNPKWMEVDSVPELFQSFENSIFFVIPCKMKMSTFSLLQPFARFLKKWSSPVVHYKTTSDIYKVGSFLGFEKVKSTCISKDIVCCRDYADLFKYTDFKISENAGQYTVEITHDKPLTDCGLILIPGDKPDHYKVIGCYKKGHYRNQISCLHSTVDQSDGSAQQTPPQPARQSNGSAQQTPPQPARQSNGSAQQTPPQPASQSNGSAQQTPPQPASQSNGSGQEPPRDASCRNDNYGVDESMNQPSVIQVFQDLCKQDVSVIQELGLLLDRRRTVGSYFPHLAERLGAPHYVRAKCESNREHSCTLDLLERPEVADRPVKDLICALSKIDNINMAGKLSKGIPEEDKAKSINEVLLTSDNNQTLLTELTGDMDKKKSGAVKNWRDLGLEFSVNRDMLKLIDLGSNPTERLLVDYAYKEFGPEKLSVGWLRQQMAKDRLNRGDVLELLKKLQITNNEDKRSMKDVFQPESDEMLKLCVLLNKDTAGIKCWKHLARAWGIEHDKYSSFNPSTKASPTEILLEWLNTSHPDITVGEVCDHLEEIGRKDALEKLKTKLKENMNAVTPAYPRPAAN